MRPARPLLAVLVAALPLAPAWAQDPGTAPRLPRVIYGAPDPSVIYGPSSPEPSRRPPAEPPPAAVQPPPAPPQGSLTYGWGPLYLPPPGYWAPPPPHWDRPGRPPPPVSVPGARGGYYEPPQPPGSYVGRPPSAPDPRWGFERPRR